MPLEMLYSGLHSCADLLHLRHIHLHREGFAAQLLDLLDERSCRSLILQPKDDVGACFRQSQRARLADPPGRSGDQRHLTIQPER